MGRELKCRIYNHKVVFKISFYIMMHSSNLVDCPRPCLSGSCLRVYCDNRSLHNTKIFKYAFYITLRFPSFSSCSPRTSSTKLRDYFFHFKKAMALQKSDSPSSGSFRDEDIKKNPYTSDADPEAENTVVGISGTAQIIDHAAERALCRKFDFRLLPVLATMYLFNALDKGNLGNAKVRRSSF